MNNSRSVVSVRNQIFFFIISLRMVSAGNDRIAYQRTVQYFFFIKSISKIGQLFAGNMFENFINLIVFSFFQRIYVDTRNKKYECADYMFQCFSFLILQYYIFILRYATVYADFPIVIMDNNKLR